MAQFPYPLGYPPLATLTGSEVVPVSAQVFRPETVNGAVLGGIAGAVIGNNSGSLNHNAWKGAAIGAVAGLLAPFAVGVVKGAISR